MKKLLSILIAISLLFSLTSCFVKEEKTENVQTQTDQKESIDTQIEQNEQEKNENPNADFLATFFGDCVCSDETDDYSYI